MIRTSQANFIVAVPFSRPLWPQFDALLSEFDGASSVLISMMSSGGGVLTEFYEISAESACFILLYQRAQHFQAFLSFSVFRRESSHCETGRSLFLHTNSQHPRYPNCYPYLCL